MYLCAVNNILANIMPRQERLQSSTGIYHVMHGMKNNNGGKPLMWQFGGGYVELNDNGTPTSWNYYITDHLGSTRMVVDSNDSIKENINYYPFGSEMRLENPALLTGSFSHPFRFTSKELDKVNNLNMYDFGARMYDVAGVPMWTSVDPLCEKYYNVSPYMYCEGDPVNAIDPDGMEIYILFYTSGNDCGDAMFRAAAETRKYDIEHSDFFDPANDIVLLIPIQDLAGISQLVGNAVDTYSENFGKTAEFSIWSHASFDGPRGTVPTSTNAIDKKQMSIEGWGNIDFNWGNGATANFYGCRTGEENGENASFATRVSSISNFRDVTVYGQTTSAYPSIYTNVRLNTQEMMKGRFSYPTYMVGGKSLGIIGSIFPTFSQANPMRSSTNGKSVVHNYYQQGRRF